MRQVLKNNVDDGYKSYIFSERGILIEHTDSSIDNRIDHLQKTIKILREQNDLLLAQYRAWKYAAKSAKTVVCIMTFAFVALAILAILK